MGWVNSPKLLCAASETVTDNANIYDMDPDSTFVVYPPTAGAYKTANGATTSTDRLQYVDVYMDDLIGSVQEDPVQKQRASKLAIRTLKDILPSLTGELKESSSLKKALVRDGEWEIIKEILGWVIDTHWGTLALSSKRRLGLISLLYIPDS